MRDLLALMHKLGTNPDSKGSAAHLQTEIVGDATRQLTDMVSEHSTWMRENCDRQVRKYRAFADARMQQLASSSASVVHPQNRSQQAGASSSGSSESADDRRQWRSAHKLLSSSDEAEVSQAVTLAAKQQETALQVGWLCQLGSCSRSYHHMCCHRFKG